MTIEVTLDQVLDDWLNVHRRRSSPSMEAETRRVVDRVTEVLNNEDTAYLLLRLLLSVPTKEGRDKALARLREEEFPGAEGVRFE